MRHEDVEIGRVYAHFLDGKMWQIKVTALDKNIGESRPNAWGWTGVLLPGQTESGNCWGYVSELSNISVDRADLPDTSL